jgi:hypothetical protein
MFIVHFLMTGPLFINGRPPSLKWTYTSRGIKHLEEGDNVLIGSLKDD